MRRIYEKYVRILIVLLWVISVLPLALANLIALLLPASKKIIPSYESTGNPLAALTVAIMGTTPLILIVEIINVSEMELANGFVHLGLTFLVATALVLRYEFFSAKTRNNS